MPDNFLFPLWNRRLLVETNWKVGEFLLPSVEGMMKRKPYKFLALLKLVEFTSDYWVGLCRCSICGQHWQLDWGTSAFEAKYAVKIPDVTDWPYSGMKIRLRFLEESRGGLSSTCCDWGDCGNLALKGSKYCSSHAYKMGARE